MRADIHDGPEHNTLQSEAGYIDARPLTASSTKTLATHGRTIHLGQSLRIYSVSGRTFVRCCSNRRQNGASRRMQRSVESRCGAVALGRTYLLPPLSSGGALMVPPWLRFHIPLIEPDRQISRIRLSDKTSRLHFRVQRHLQFLNTHRSL